jgi:thiamine kinase-like enzyme
MSQRWGQYAKDDSWRLDGDTVAHTDLHGYNILIGSDARFVDWSWPTLAAPWIDTACVALKLIQAGHAPHTAERWCQQTPAFADADQKAVSVFVDAARALWRDISESSAELWKREVADAAGRWANHRGL